MPDAAGGVPALRVVARDVTLRERPGKLADGTRVRGLLQHGQLVEARSQGQGPWWEVAYGDIVGWALADDGRSGADRRVWLEPVS